MSTFMTNNAAQLLIVFGLGLIALEVIALSFASFFLLFAGFALISTGALIGFGIMNPTLSMVVSSNVVLTVVYAGLLWQPLKRLQLHQQSHNVRSDFDGLRFYCQHDIDDRGLTKHRHSGVTWCLKSEQPIQAGSEVEVVQVEVGVFWVRATAHDETLKPL